MSVTIATETKGKQQLNTGSKTLEQQEQEYTSNEESFKLKTGQHETGFLTP